MAVAVAVVVVVLAGGGLALARVPLCGCGVRGCGNAGVQLCKVPSGGGLPELAGRCGHCLDAGGGDGAPHAAELRIVRAGRQEPSDGKISP